MIARKILALPNVVQQAAPGDVSTRGLPERCSIVRIKTKTLQVVAASGDSHRSRPPTRTGPAKRNVQQHLFNFVQSKAAPLQVLGEAGRHLFRSVRPLQSLIKIQ